MLRPQPLHVLTEPRDRPRPADPLSDHRRRHLRISASNARTLASNGVNDVAAARRSYLGGASDATAFDHRRPRRSPTAARPAPSAPPPRPACRINAQSSKVITLQSSSAHFSSVATAQFSSVVDTVRLGQISPRLTQGFHDVTLRTAGAVNVVELYVCRGTVTVRPALACINAT